MVQSARSLRSLPRTPIARAGTTVMQDMVEMLVIGEFPAGHFLPPEAILGEQFGVSRTVIRECMKRLQEKGMVTVAQGRGTQVNAFTSWNVLDPLVLTTLIAHDESIGVLDEVSTVRASLESVMAAEVATAADPAVLETVTAAIDRMREAMGDESAFYEADAAFHFTVMAGSGNRIAGNVTRVLFGHARASFRFEGLTPSNASELTMREHEQVHAAILAGDADAARRSMEAHILGSWHRRRFPATPR